MWKIRAPQRLKSFMWLALNDALLTNRARYRRGLAANDTCALCSRFPKTTLHAIRDCEVVKKAWKSVGNNFIKNSFFQKPLMALIEENLLDEVRSLKGMDWSLIFLTACYLAWFNRNLAVLENNTNAHTYLDCRIWNLARNYDQNLQLVQRAKAKIPAVKHI